METEEIRKKNDLLEKELQAVRLKLEQSENQLNKKKLTDNFMEPNEEKSEPSPKKYTVEEKVTIKQQKDESQLEVSSKPDSSRLEKKYDFGDSP